MPGESYASIFDDWLESIDKDSSQTPNYADSDAFLRALQLSGTNALPTTAAAYGHNACMFQCAAQSITATGDYQLKPTAIYTNAFGGITLPSIPPELGVSVAVDGSSGMFTITRAGLICFMSTSSPVADSTWRGWLHDYNSLTFCASVNAGWPAPNVPMAVSTTYFYPAGENQAFYVKTQTAATANPYNVGGRVFVVRISG